MSSDGQSVSIDGPGSAAIAERSAGVACTAEKPGIDPNQSEFVDTDEQPASAKASSAAAPHAPTHRSTEYTGPLAPEAGLLQEPDRGGIGGDAGGLDPVQPQGPERKRNQGGHRRGHVAMAGESRAHPVAKAAGLGAAAPDIGERQTPDQDLIALAEDEERIGQVAALILRIAADAPAEGGAGEVIDRPGRLPGREEVTARRMQRRPFRIVGILGRAQRHAIPHDGGQLLGETDRAKERHGGLRDQAAFRARLSAIVAALSRPGPGPSAATAGRPRAISARPAARALSTVTPSMRATSSSSGIGRPQAKIWRASCSVRALELSSAIKSPAFICALARAISASLMVSAALVISPTTTRISSGRSF